MKQLALLKNESSAHGGELFKTREGRRRPRPLDTRHTMHLVLRSSRARGPWSFRRPYHARRIREITRKFSERYGIKILSSANVGNHLHFQIKLSNRYTYRPFIRAVTSAIAMAVSGTSRWTRRPSRERPQRFWDYRPFTRVVRGWRAWLGLRDYIRVNQLEGFGYAREEARWLVERSRAPRFDSS
jgi:hypothetical protein